MTRRERDERQAQSWQLSEILLIAISFALVTGLAEVFIQAVRKFILHKFIDVGADVVWMAPLAYSIAFSIFGLALSCISYLRPRLLNTRMIIFVFAFFSLFSLLFMFHPQLHKLAAMILAAGLAAQSSRFIAGNSQELYAFYRRTMGWSLALIAGLTIGVYGVQIEAERRALAHLPPASRNAPNVMLIVLDTVRAQNLSLYGYPRDTTPRLKELAKTGVVFERAMSTAPWTLPSHASMLTGRLPHELSTNWLTPLDSTYQTLAEVLNNYGYITAGFVANTGYCSYEQGLHRGFVHYEDYVISAGQIALSSSLGRYITDSRRLRRIVGYHQTLGRKTAAQLNEHFLRWLSRKDERPFFAFLNYYDAHGPYLPPFPYDVKFGPDRPGEWLPLAHKQQVSLQEIQAMTDGYDGSIAYLDFHLGLLLDELENRRLLQNTIVIITSDHGEEFGEHDVFDHGNSLYLPSVHVPLLIVFPPKVPRAKKVHEPVTLRNIPVTVIDLLKLEGGVRFPGQSLARHWQSTDDGRVPVEMVVSEVKYAKNVPSWLPVNRGDMTSLIADGWRYIKNGDGREELYDFYNDSAEQHNLMGSEEAIPAIKSVRAALETIRRASVQQLGPK